ncbi:hypothetical protein GOP47_0011020 [Adiantum capillus-veneris]|uniref:Late embryogenesis abundant protein LEA-2 subgroup domain-containing protein n=1 Tax=Adiantum capillus-veneris TaxID=13818 RepID=A0A9D4UWC4_ADICA|nr:hypothetical protein GOP47_0011020 [Adiantum capillus-veneris]
MAIAIGAAALACGATGAALYRCRPRDPIFEVQNIELKGFNVRFAKLMAVVDAQLVITIKVINPNVAPIEYTSTTMDIFYQGVLLGQAIVEAGDQGPNSKEVIQVQAKLDGQKMTKNLKELLTDVRKREMCMKSVVTIKGHARLWKWTHDFVVHVESTIKVDPVYLVVIDQDNKVHMELAPLVS